jgi:flagellar basal-body rod protein FlgB
MAARLCRFRGRLPDINHTPGKVCLAGPSGDPDSASISGIAGGTVAITDIPILSMMRTKMNWAQERQKVLAENVANSDTPNYRERDLVAPKFEDSHSVFARPVVPVVLARTESGHIGGVGTTSSQFQTTSKTNHAVGPTGNSVSLEDEMMKVAANQMDYQAVTALYSRSLNLLKVALGKR